MLNPKYPLLAIILLSLAGSAAFGQAARSPFSSFGLGERFSNAVIQQQGNTLRFESNSRALAEAVPDVFALPAIYDRLALCITDALICQYQGEQRTLLHYATPLNQLRFSKDPVALDTLSLAELEAQRQKAGIPSTKFSSDLYKNAALLELGINDARQIRMEMK